MLIYVDKKAQKRKKIKICLLILFGIFFVFENVFHFKDALYTNKNSLISYNSIKNTNSWYNQTDCFYIFSNPQTSLQKVIIIPPFFNKKIALMIVAALSKYKKENNKITLMPELTSNKKLQTLIKNILPNSSLDAKNHIIITSDYESVKDLIIKEELYPTILNYTQAQKKNTESNIIASLFPPKPLPQNKIEEEKLALENFVKDNLKALKKFTNKNQLPFNLENIFLQNIRFCIETPSQTLCQTNDKTSFKKGLNQIFTQIEESSPKTLVLFTSDKKISANTLNDISLEEDEGIHFSYHNFESFLLPNEIKELANDKNLFYTLKQKAGINPEYKNPKMKFFKFKIVEIALNDNI